MAVDYGHTKIARYALKVSVFKVLKLDTIRKKKKIHQTTNKHGPGRRRRRFTKLQLKWIRKRTATPQQRPKS